LRTLSLYSIMNTPSQPAKDCCNKLRKGKDGFMYRSVANKNGVYCWRKVKPTRGGGHYEDCEGTLDGHVKTPAICYKLPGHGFDLASITHEIRSTDTCEDLAELYNQYFNYNNVYIKLPGIKAYLKQPLHDTNIEFHYDTNQVYSISGYSPVSILKKFEYALFVKSLKKKIDISELQKELDKLPSQVMIERMRDRGSKFVPKSKPKPTYKSETHRSNRVASVVRRSSSPRWGISRPLRPLRGLATPLPHSPLL